MFEYMRSKKQNERFWYISFEKCIHIPVCEAEMQTINLAFCKILLLLLHVI